MGHQSGGTQVGIAASSAWLSIYLDTFINKSIFDGRKSRASAIYYQNADAFKISLAFRFNFLFNVIYLLLFLQLS